MVREFVSSADEGRVLPESFKKPKEAIPPRGQEFRLQFVLLDLLLRTWTFHPLEELSQGLSAPTYCQNTCPEHCTGTWLF